jgi:2-polyprenyl-3-methyl-5-hydroxy-6-metoxy-1,4-benzoquinol methylase
VEGLVIRTVAWPRQSGRAGDRPADEWRSMSRYRCRFCLTALHHTFCDLGMSPLSNALVPEAQLKAPEVYYPLHVFVCGQCWLVQLPEHESPQHIFSQDYVYFSSYSESWLAHARTYVDAMIQRFGYGASSRVVEIASNDGYLLQYFVERGIPVLGVEPAQNCAKVAKAKGIPTEVTFFGEASARDLVKRHGPADLVLGNNVLAHVPDINDFVAGLKLMLKAGGVVTMEFPHLLRLMAENQFDTIYHEHYSYLSLLTVTRIFAAHDLALFDVEELGTHGGSLRIFAKHADEALPATSMALAQLQEREAAAGLQELDTYHRFGRQAEETRFKLLDFLIAARRTGKRVWGYGAPAKGSTLLNYCGIRTDLLEATVDLSPHKQGMFMPGSRIPIFAPDALRKERPDYVLILPWNLQEEITRQMADVREWGGQFVSPIPQVRVLA